MAQYDPKILQQFSDILYRRAASLIFWYTLLGLIVGLIAAGIIGATASQAMRNSSLGFVIGCFIFILVTAFGYAIGNSRALNIKLQAQLALCQKQIEDNTRQCLKTILGNAQPIQPQCPSQHKQL